MFSNSITAWLTNLSTSVAERTHAAIMAVNGNFDEGNGTVYIVDALLPVGGRSVQPRIDLVREGHYGTAKHTCGPAHGEAELQFVTLNRTYAASYVSRYFFP
ncbi:MAG: hypothetical protein ACJ71Q_04415 [Terriglobales bacterium]